MTTPTPARNSSTFSRTVPPAGISPITKCDEGEKVAYNGKVAPPRRGMRSLCGVPYFAAYGGMTGGV
eukprot:3397799-Rhodomonas_salina.4